MAKIVRAWCQLYAPNPIAVRVLESFGGKIFAESQSLEDHRVIAMRLRLQIEQQRSAAGDLVGKAAADPQGKIELGGNRHGPRQRGTPRGFGGS